MSESPQDLAGVKPDAGQVGAGTISGINRNLQSGPGDRHRTEHRRTHIRVVGQIAVRILARAIPQHSAVGQFAVQVQQHGIRILRIDARAEEGRKCIAVGGMNAETTEAPG